MRTMKQIKKVDNIKFLLLLSCILYLAGRIFFLCIYNFTYTDEDQVVMWLGTVLFTHGQIREPMWLGQNYGSMLESLLAVPMYICKIPLNIALPVSSFIIGLAPFVVIMVCCMKEKKYFQGWMVLLVLLLFSVDMDVLTSIPRTFIPGYCFSVTGLLICIKSNKISKQIIGGFFSAIGVVMSETAICIILPVLIYILWNKKNLWRHIWAFIGIAAGIGINNICMLFYEKHPEFLVWGKPELSFDFNLFINRIHEFTTYFANLIIFQNAWIFLSICIGLFIFLIATDNIGSALMVIATIGGLFLTLGFSKMGMHDCVLWSATRMLLFVPYNISIAIYLSGLEQVEEKIRTYLSEKQIRKMFTLVAIIVVFMSIFIKYVDYKSRESAFKTSNLNTIISVQELKNYVQQEYRIMIENGCDFALVPHSTHALALQALYNGKVTAYPPVVYTGILMFFWTN